MKFGGGPSPGGSIRNTLGSGLKSSGFFQKDGQINNMRGGFIGTKNPPYSQGVYPQQSPYGYGQFNGMQGMPGPQISAPGVSKQFILQPAQQGIFGNGVATISPDNSFSLMANLPQPGSFVGHGSAAYAAYLVDNKGKTGFLAGIMRPIGNGMYQVHFRSPVPLSHYDKVIVSVENPGQLGHSPAGPIVLMVKGSNGASTFIKPIKSAGGAIWGKITGLFRGRNKVEETPALPPNLDSEVTSIPDTSAPISPVNPTAISPVNPTAISPVNPAAISPSNPVTSSPASISPANQALELSPELINPLNEMNVQVPRPTGLGPDSAKF